MPAFDISRVAFRPKKRYSSVRMQQGRVLTDDDWNENQSIENEERRRSRSDIIGAFGSPDKGFRIENLRYADGRIDFDIHQGVLHLSGLRLEMSETETFRLQSDWLNQNGDFQAMPQLDISAPEVADFDNINELFTLVYLAAWPQAVSAVEDSELYEKALGGPDTTTRVRHMRRVQLTHSTEEECSAAWQALRSQWETQQLGKLDAKHERIPDIRLKVSFDEEAISNDPCIPSIQGGYLGAENQAIRVQLIDSNHFTWGFDNAAPFYKVRLHTDGDGNRVIVNLQTLPKDQHHWMLSGQVVEILPSSAILPNGEKIAALSGHLSKVERSWSPEGDGVFPENYLTIDDAVPSPFGTEWALDDNGDPIEQTPEYFYMRVWNRGADLDSPAAIAFDPTETDPLNAVVLGQTGLKINIFGNDPVANDYWVIAVRPETPDVLVPWQFHESRGGLHSTGVRRFFAPLAIIRWTLGVDNVIEGKIIHDCRKTFRPLTDLEGCCTYHVGDGISSHGDFTSIEEAVEHLPPQGGKICVLPGRHFANVSIFRRTNISICGCGEQTIVMPRNSDSGRISPIFSIGHAQNIRLENMVLLAPETTAIQVLDDNPKLVPSSRITIKDNRIFACIHAIRVEVLDGQSGINDIWIAHNYIGMFDKEEGEAAIFCLADGVLIERNRIVVIQNNEPEEEEEPQDNPDDTGGFFDPCADRIFWYSVAFQIYPVLQTLFQYVAFFVPIARPKPYLAQGGIQIGNTSEGVKIINNQIIGGYGNGITLGHLPRLSEELGDFKPQLNAMLKTGLANNLAERLRRFLQNNFNSTLYDIVIETNQIRDMGRSGIGVPVWFNLQELELVQFVEDVTIYRNDIQRCAHQIPEELPDELVQELSFGGITLAGCENLIIQENRIENNGVVHTDPICGVFILYGEKIELSHNRILNNGPRISNINNRVRPGVRGGIVLKMSFAEAQKTFNDENPSISFDDVPAAKIHSNIVNQPFGHALFITTMGPVSVLGNQLTSHGIHVEDRFSQLAGAVFILNLGVSKDLLFQFLVRPIFRALAQLDAPFQAANPEDLQSFNEFLRQLQLLPSGAVMFSHNQTTLDLRGIENDISISAQMIISLDDVAFINNQLECASLIQLNAQGISNADIVLFNTMLAGFSVRTQNNRFQEGFSLTAFSLFSIAYMNATTGNQSTHCLLPVGHLNSTNEVIEILNQVLNSDRCSDEKGAFDNAYGNAATARPIAASSIIAGN